MRAATPAPPATASDPPSQKSFCTSTTSRATGMASVGSVRRRLAGRLQGDVGGGEAGDGDAEGRARDVVETEPVEEEDGVGVAAVLAAHPRLEVGADAPGQFQAPGHQLADALLVDGLERVGREDPLVEVARHEPGLD